MIVTIQSKYFTSEEQNLLVNFAEWSGKKLLNRLHNNVKVDIEVVGKRVYEKEDMVGVTEIHPDDNWTNPRHFIIKLANCFGIMKTLVVLGHEMVHVKQQARRELIRNFKTEKMMWQGSPIQEDEFNYWDLPWEIEANGREKGLVYQWAEKNQYDKSKWFKLLY